MHKKEHPQHHNPDIIEYLVTLRTNDDLILYPQSTYRDLIDEMSQAEVAQVLAKQLFDDPAVFLEHYGRQLPHQYLTSAVFQAFAQENYEVHWYLSRLGISLPPFQQEGFDQKDSGNNFNDHDEDDDNDEKFISRAMMMKITENNNSDQMAIDTNVDRTMDQSQAEIYNNINNTSNNNNDVDYLDDSFGDGVDHSAQQNTTKPRWKPFKHRYTTDHHDSQDARDLQQVPLTGLIQNRRYRAMIELEQNTDYFGWEKMSQRQPALYDQYIARYQASNQPLKLLQNRPQHKKLSTFNMTEMLCKAASKDEALSTFEDNTDVLGNDDKKAVTTDNSNGQAYRSCGYGGAQKGTSGRTKGAWLWEEDQEEEDKNNSRGGRRATGWRESGNNSNETVVDDGMGLFSGRERKGNTLNLSSEPSQLGCKRWGSYTTQSSSPSSSSSCSCSSSSTPTRQQDNAALETLRNEFISIMKESFLQGQDVEFDYTKVDHNEKYDDDDMIDQDAQDKYFDE